MESITRYYAFLLLVGGRGAGFLWCLVFFSFPPKTLCKVKVTPFDQGALPGTWYGPILSELQLGIYFLEKFYE